MATSERFEVYPVTFDKNNVTPVHFQQLQGFRIQTNNQISVIRPAGQTKPLAHVLSSANPQIPLQTRDLLKFFTNVLPDAGYCPPDATFRLRERSRCGEFETGATHLTLECNGGGALMADSLRVEQDSVDGAIVSANFWPFSDGTILPIVVVDGVDLAGAPVPIFNSQYYLGAIYHNGVEVRGVTSATLNFGVNFVPSKQTPGPYNTTGSIVTLEPTLQFTTLKVDEVANTNLFISPVNTSMVFYLQAGAAGSDRVPRATAGHISFSFTAGAIETTEIGGDGGSDAQLQTNVRIEGIIAVSTAAAIP